MSAPAANSKHLIFDSTLDGTTTTGVSSVVDVSQMESVSFQCESASGGATVTVDIQKSLKGTRADGWATPRSDTYSSTDWVTVVTYTLAAGAPAVTDVPYAVGRAYRAKLTRTAGSGNVKVIYFTQGV